MSKKIVIDKDDWDKFLENISTNKRFLLNITEIDTDQSIEERAKEYTNEKEKGFQSRFNVYKKIGYIKGATEQSLIEQMKAKELNLQKK